MAREQTVFSELTVAMAIGNCDPMSVVNVDSQSLCKYKTEALKRKKINSNSEAELVKAGKRVREWLISEKKISKIKVIWTGMETGLDNGPVARDLLISGTNIRISVKENAQLFQNPSPVKVFDKWPRGLYDKSRDEDWFLKVAAKELNDYYRACGGFEFTGFRTVEDYYQNVVGSNSKGIKRRKGFTDHVASLHDKELKVVLEAYRRFCAKVSESSAEIFNSNVRGSISDVGRRELDVQRLSQLFSFFFKLDNEEYVLCGTEDRRAFSVLVSDLVTWGRKFKITNVVARPLYAGQPEVLITFSFTDIYTQRSFDYSIQCQIRWSHGKFCGNPESKLYRYSSWSYTNIAWAVLI